MSYIVKLSSRTTNLWLEIFNLIKVGTTLFRQIHFFEVVFLKFLNIFIDNWTTRFWISYCPHKILLT